MSLANQNILLIPVTILALWTFLVLVMLPVARFKAILGGECKINDFKRNETENVPGYVVTLNRNYMNLLEMPVLFYLVSVLFFLLKQGTVLVLVFSGLYVFLRVLHSIVHITYNNVMHRFLLFASSNVVLLIIWLMWVFNLLVIV